MILFSVLCTLWLIFNLPLSIQSGSSCLPGIIEYVQKSGKALYCWFYRNKGKRSLEIFSIRCFDGQAWCFSHRCKWLPTDTRVYISVCIGCYPEFGNNVGIEWSMNTNGVLVVCGLWSNGIHWVVVEEESIRYEKTVRNSSSF